MTTQVAFGLVRIVVAIILELLIAMFGLAEMAKPPTHGSVVWRHIWPSACAVTAVAVLWHVVYHGDFRLRIVATLLIVFPCLVLYYVVASHFDFSTPLDRWFYGLG